jgi:RluA family pseudouridine synthase
MSKTPLPPVLFEDEAIIAFDKPSGLLVAPEGGDVPRENLMDLVHQRLSQTIFNVHRLDRDTSGILLCAKTKPALDFLSGQFQDKSISKRYVAITLGSPLEDEILVNRHIGKDETNPGKMKLTRTYGKAAETLVRVITRFRGYALIEAFPKTGRTHQIRIHLQSLGSPILADPIYGDPEGLLLSAIKTKYKQKEDEPERPLIGRLALHAQTLEFIHPSTNEPFKIESELPHDFEVAIKYLKRFAGL